LAAQKNSANVEAVTRTKTNKIATSEAVTIQESKFEAAAPLV